MPGLSTDTSRSMGKRCRPSRQALRNIQSARKMLHSPSRKICRGDDQLPPKRHLPSRWSKKPFHPKQLPIHLECDEKIWVFSRILYGLRPFNEGEQGPMGLQTDTRWRRRYYQIRSGSLIRIFSGSSTAGSVF